VLLTIENDLNRFKKIVRGRVREDLRRFMSSGELLGKQGKQVVSVPLPEIQLPRFQYGPNESGGVGQGDGGEGDGVDGAGKAGDAPGEHILEADVTFEELAEILAEELELPRIEPKGARDVQSKKDVYRGIAVTGPESLRHNRRTYREALKRMISAGTYNPRSPVIIPIPSDKRYRSWTVEQEPQSAAVVIYMMDVSGSMGREQKEIVRLEAFWIDLWLRHNYRNVETRFIIHDAVAREVERDTFFRTRESGGTLISSAYKLCLQILDADYNSSEWNIYPFHFSDGDNWSASDTRGCIELLKERILPVSNQFSYGQVDSEYGSGQFFNDLTEQLDEDERVVLSRIPERESIMDSIREFLGRGR